MSGKRIMLAVSPEDADYTRGIIGPEFDYLFCHTLREARERVSADIALIACGVHFAEGSMFELLRYVKGHPSMSAIPFIVVLKEGTNHSAAVVNGIRSAATLLGVDSFVDLSEFSSADPAHRIQSYEKLRGRLRSLLSST
jgi:hypothetical protein